MINEEEVCIACSGELIPSYDGKTCYSHTIPGACTPTIDKCTKCQTVSNKEICIECETNYFPSFDGISCVQNLPEACVVDASLTNCETCQTVASQKICIHCQTGFGPSESGSCVAQDAAEACTSPGDISHCQKCQLIQGEKICIECEENFYPAGDGKTCVQKPAEACSEVPGALTNCDACQNVGGNAICIQCKENYNLVDGACVPKPAEACSEVPGSLTNCDACQNVGEATICISCTNSLNPQLDGTCSADTATLNCEGTIANCGNCRKYGENEICIECQNDLVPSADGTQCVSPVTTCSDANTITGCSTCVTLNNEKICTTCGAGSKPSPDGKSCVLESPPTCSGANTITGCSACVMLNNEKVCTTCGAGSKPSPDGKSCVSEPPATCSTPGDITDCTACQMVGNEKICTNCGTDKTPSVNGKACAPKSTSSCTVDDTLPNCVRCQLLNSQKICIECENGYSPSSDGLSCIKKPSETCTINSDFVKCSTCQNIEDDSICTSCETGFVPSVDGKLCISETKPTCTPTIGDCQECQKVNDVEICIKCKNDLVPNVDGKGCVQAASVCTIDNCKTCATPPTTCAECQSGFTTSVDKTRCESCTTVDAKCNSCKYEANTLKCLTCSDGLIVDSTTNKCVESSTTDKCVEGSNGCKTCNADKTACIACQEANYKPEGIRCVSNSQTCNVDHCSKCVSNDPSTCETCESNYDKSADGKTCTLKKSSQCNDLNCKDCENDAKVCKECNENYGLRNGQCVKCEEGYWNGGQNMCGQKCTIEHCDKCIFENGKEFCILCKEFYKVSNNQKSCVAQTCTEWSSGCSKCNSTAPPFICEKCDKNKKYKEDPENGKCVCDENLKEFNGYCYSSAEYECVSNQLACVHCDESEKCTECMSGFTLKNGECEPPIVSCPMANCKICGNFFGEILCGECEKGFKYSEDSRYCIKDNEKDCPSKVEGCSKCYESPTNLCKVCDEANHFIESKREFGKCVCDPNYDYVNGQCIEAIGPILKPDLDLAEITTSLITPEENGEYTINTASDQFPEKGADGFKATLPSEASVLNVPSGLTDLHLILTNLDTFTVKPANKNDKLDLEVNKATTITVPQDSTNINLEGTGAITLNPSDEKAKEVKIGKVYPEGDSGIEFVNPKQNIDISQVQVFKKTLIKGQNGEQKTTCEKIILQGGSELDLEHVTVKEVFIGIKSVFNIKTNDVTFPDNSNFHLYYNRSLGFGTQQFPIIIQKFKPNFGKSMKINVVPHNPDNLIELEAVEELPIARIEDIPNEDLEKYCNDNLKGMFQNSQGFKDAKCIKDENGNGCNLVARKQQDPPKDDDKKGLSGGAIAGIVIACVVVVAAIIALLVYFLVIKKKNQSTTSTQGDSSIAI